MDTQAYVSSSGTLYLFVYLVGSGSTPLCLNVWLVALKQSKLLHAPVHLILVALFSLQAFRLAMCKYGIRNLVGRAFRFANNFTYSSSPLF